MQNIQIADFLNNEKINEREKTLSKSADILSTRELILSLNDSFVARKSKEYNFDFSKESSYDSTSSNSSLSGGKQDNLFQSYYEADKSKELKFTGRKTSYSGSSNEFINKESHFSCNFENIFAYKKNRIFAISESADSEPSKSKGTFTRSNSECNSVTNFNCNNQSNLKCFSNSNNFSNLNTEANKEIGFPGLKSHHNISNFSRKTNIDAFKKLKERFRILQQQKKNFLEFFEAKNHKENSDFENDNTNVYFE